MPQRKRPPGRPRTPRHLQKTKVLQVAFTPSDFGWSSWPSGKFWFDVTVDKQGQMNAAASHAGNNDSRENWTASRIAPSKSGHTRALASA